MVDVFRTFVHYRDTEHTEISQRESKLGHYPKQQGREPLERIMGFGGAAQTKNNAQHERAYTALGLKPGSVKAADQEQARQWMCQRFFDVRMFGAVMTTGTALCGRFRDPCRSASPGRSTPCSPRNTA